MKIFEDLVVGEGKITHTERVSTPPHIKAALEDMMRILTEYHNFCIANYHNISRGLIPIIEQKIKEFNK
jgi:hypothetical protein